MKKFFLIFLIIFAVISCANNPDLETSEIQTLKLLKNKITELGKPKEFVDARKLLTRERIDKFAIPILFVEMETGQNGTLTLYPGKGVGQTWLGSDGATITLENGVLKASRGMGDDLMGVDASMPDWEKIQNDGATYFRKTSYLSGNNKIISRNFRCSINYTTEKENLKIWNVDFRVKRYEEICNDFDLKIKNIYYLDDNKRVRSSYQYHSETIGYLRIERIDR